MMQKTDFSFDVIIGEDCSTDSTPLICDEYATKYQNIKVYHHNPNKGLVKNWEFVMNHCQGKYVALMEGDDYWTDCNKLQRQVDWLERHPTYSITSTNVTVVCEGSSPHDGCLWFNHRKEGEVRPVEYLKPGICQTSSVVMRNVLRPLQYPDWMYITDTYTFLLAAQRGKAYHFAKETSVYRRHGGNVTQQNSFSDCLGYMNWARQFRMMQTSFPDIKMLLLQFEKDNLNILNTFPRRNAPSNLWKFRIRYMMLNKKLIFSSYILRTILYLPIIKLLHR